MVTHHSPSNLGVYVTLESLYRISIVADCTNVVELRSSAMNVHLAYDPERGMREKDFAEFEFHPRTLCSMRPQQTEAACIPHATAVCGIYKPDSEMRCEA